MPPGLPGGFFVLGVFGERALGVILRHSKGARKGPCPHSRMVYRPLRSCFPSIKPRTRLRLSMISQGCR